MLKFFNAEPFDLPLVEHATMTLAQQAGMQVARTLPIALGAEHALAVKRFDRAGGKRVHSISACRLLRAEVSEGMDPEFGYPQLARALRRAADPRTLDAQLQELFRRMVFNILVANGDDHEKNHALLCHTSGRTMKLELGPAYDVAPTGSGALAHQLMVSETSREPSLAEALGGAESFNLSPLDAANTVASIIAVVNGWQAHFRALGVTESDILEVAALIDAPDLLAQRKSFNVGVYAGSVKPRRKPAGGAKASR